MSKIYECSIEVRGYELDSFGHVNHASYVSYLEHARWKMLQSEGITLTKMNEWKRWPVIAQLEVKYLKPTYMGDFLDVSTQIIGHEKTHFRIQHSIRRQGQPVLTAQIICVIVDEKGKPASMPEELGALWTPPSASSPSSPTELL